MSPCMGRSLLAEAFGDLKRFSYYTGQLPIRIELCESQFIYVSRSDATFVTDLICKNLGLIAQHTRVRATYDTFCESAAELILQYSAAQNDRGQSSKFLVFSSDDLNSYVTNEVVSKLVSLDPLLQTKADNIEASRCYDCSGTWALGVVARPLTAPLAVQIEWLATQAAGESVVVCEDTIYSGETARLLLQKLQERGVQVESVRAGFSLARSATLQCSTDVPLEAAVTFQGIANPSAHIDVVGFRNLLLGVSGLVVHLPSGNTGRVPYLLPFTDAGARLELGHQQALVFSQKMLELNRRFFEQLATLRADTIRLSELSADCIEPLEALYDYRAEDSIVDIIAAVQSHLKATSKRSPHTVPENFKHVALSTNTAHPKLVLIDINGTMIRSGENLLAISSAERALLAAEIRRLQASGAKVAFLSDSPEQGLSAVSKLLGMTTPAFFELGIGTLSNTAEQASCPELLQEIRESVRKQLASIAPEVSECLSQEFGGKRPLADSGCWCFGLGRQFSLAVFGHDQAIRAAWHLLVERLGFSPHQIDCSPSSGFLSIYPTAYSLRELKRQLIRDLSNSFASVAMIGDSLADWYPARDNVQTRLVSNNRVAAELLHAQCIVSAGDYRSGVLEHLREL